MANPVSFDPVTGKPNFGNDIANPAAQFQANADYAESVGPRSVANFAALAAVQFKRPGMQRVTTDTGVVYVYISAAAGWFPLFVAPTAESTWGTAVSGVISNTVIFWTLSIAALPYPAVIDLDWNGQGYNASGNASTLSARFAASGGTLSQPGIQQFAANAGAWVACPWSARLTLPANTSSSLALSSNSSTAAQFNGAVRFKRSIT